MITLFINTALRETQIALIDNERTIFKKSWESARNEAEKLMPEINKSLSDNNLDFKNLGQIFVVNGPGSFTSLRVGLTVANTMAYLLNIPVKTVNTIEFLWGFLPKEIKNIAVLLYAGSRGVYVSLTSDTGIEGSKIKLVNINELNQYLKINHITEIFGEISEEQRNLLNEFSWYNPSLSFSEICLELLSNINGEKKFAMPIYIKPPEITESKKSI